MGGSLSSSPEIQTCTNSGRTIYYGNIVNIGRCSGANPGFITVPDTGNLRLSNGSSPAIVGSQSTFVPGLILIPATQGSKGGPVRFGDFVYIKLAGSYDTSWYLKFDPSNDNGHVHYFFEDKVSDQYSYTFQVLGGQASQVVTDGASIVLEANHNVSYSSSDSPLCSDIVTGSIPECSNGGACIKAWNCDQSSNQQCQPPSNNCKSTAFYVSISPTPVTMTACNGCGSNPLQYLYAGSLASSSLGIYFVSSNIPLPDPNTTFNVSPSWPDWSKMQPLKLMNGASGYNQYLTVSQAPDDPNSTPGGNGLKTYMGYGDPGNMLLQNDSSGRLSVLNVTGNHGSYLQSNNDAEKDNEGNAFQLTTQSPDTFTFNDGNIFGTVGAGVNVGHKYLLCADQDSIQNNLYQEFDLGNVNVPRCQWYESLDAYECCNASNVDFSKCPSNFIPTSPSSQCSTLMTDYCSNYWKDQDPSVQSNCLAYLQSFKDSSNGRNLVRNTILNYITSRSPQDYIKSRDQKDPFFTTVLPQLAEYVSDVGTCDDILDCLCAQFTPDDLVNDSTLQQICGCHLFTGNSYTSCPTGMTMTNPPQTTNQYTLSFRPECNPVCRFGGTVTTPRYTACDMSECIVDNFVVNNVDSKGCVNISVDCSNCGQSGCQCYVSQQVVDQVTNMNKNGQCASISEQCAECFIFDPKNPTDVQKVDGCDFSSYGGGGSSNSFSAWLANNKILVIGGASLLLLVIIGVILYMVL